MNKQTTGFFSEVELLSFYQCGFTSTNDADVLVG